MKKVLCVICALGMLITAAFSVMTFTASAAGDIDLLDKSKIDPTQTTVQYDIKDGTWTLTATEANQKIGIAGPGEYKSADGTFIGIEVEADVPFSVSLFDGVNKNADGTAKWINLGGDFGGGNPFPTKPYSDQYPNTINAGQYSYTGDQINLAGCYKWNNVTNQSDLTVPETLAITSVYIILRDPGTVTFKALKLTDGVMDPDPNAPEYEEYISLMPSAETPSEPGNKGTAKTEFAEEGKAFTVTVLAGENTWPAVDFDIDDVVVDTKYFSYLQVKGSGEAKGNLTVMCQVMGPEDEEPIGVWIQVAELIGIGTDGDFNAVDRRLNLNWGSLAAALKDHNTTAFTITKIRVSSAGDVNTGFTWEDIALMKEKGVEVPTTATTTSTDSTSTDSSTSDTTTSTDSSSTETTTTKTDTPEPGDINRDGKPNTVEDAYDLYLATSGKVALDPIAKAVADIYADGEVDTIDAYFLYLRVAGLAA